MFCVEKEVTKGGLQQGQVHASMLAVILCFHPGSFVTLDSTFGCNFVHTLALSTGLEFASSIQKSAVETVDSYNFVQ